MSKNPYLPKHVSVSKTGVYQYRRVVPEPLRPLVGKREIKQSLGKDYAAMLKKHAALEANVMKLLAQKPHRNTNARIKVLSKLREYGLDVQSLVAAREVDPDDPDDFIYAVDAALQELEEDPEIPPEIIRGVAAGDLPATIESALDDYKEYRIMADPSRQKLTEQACERHKTLLIRVLGKDAVCRRRVERIKRADARAVRDHLLQEGQPTTARRVLNDISAAVNRAILEYDLEMVNPFSRLEIAGAQHSKEQRLPLEDSDMMSLAPVMETVDDLGLIWWTLRDTGARLKEVVGLRCCDLNEAKAVIHIRPYTGHRLKTKNSERDVPIPAALATALGKKKGDDSAKRLFPAYDRNRGTDSCSQALMKRLRKIIKDERKTVHSLRHRFKDLLRDTDCPENLAREIMGHSDQSIAANYGRGASLERKRAAMEKVWKRCESLSVDGRALAENAS